MIALLLALSSIAGVGLCAILGFGGVRHLTQGNQDKLRRRYKLSRSREVPVQSLTEFIRALSGLRLPTWSRILNGVETVVFEVYADQGGIQHRMSVPNRTARHVIDQLKVTGVKVERIPRSDDGEWQESLELGLTSSRIPLRIPNIAATINSVLRSFSSLRENDAVMMQWVITPAALEPTSSEDKPHLEKNREPTFQAVVRIVARSAEDYHAKRLVQSVRAAMAATEAYGVRFRERARGGRVKHSVLTQRTPVTFPSTLNVNELAALIGFPAGELSIPGLPQGASRQLPADPSIPTEGLVIGRSNFSGDERPLAIDPSDLLRHMWIGGQTGTGKSTLLHNLSVQIMKQGYGMMLLEPKGDLVQDVLSSVPDDRIQDVILFDPSDTQFPVGLNILAGPDPERIAGHIVSLFRQIYSESWGPRLEQILRYAVLTAAYCGLTLRDVKQLLMNPAYRRGLTRKIRNPDVREFWIHYERFPDTAADSVINKLDAFLGNSIIRNIIGQPDTAFDLANAINSGKILLVPMQSGLLGDANASMLGSMLMSSVWQAARGRAGIPRDKRQPFFLLIDEFQNYLNLPVAISDALAQARGYGLGIILANQHLAQLKNDVKPGVMANTGSKVVFPSSYEDAKALANEFSPYLEASDLQNLGKYEAVLKLMSGGQSAPPATADLPGPPRPTGHGQSVREASRAVYSRPVRDVEADFAIRNKSLSEDDTKPTVGRVDDDS